MTVLDASALLAFLFREPGHDKVVEVMSEACISTVNLAEVLGRFSRDGVDAGPIGRRLCDSALEIVPFSRQQAELCAAMLPRTRLLGLSLGDRACLALAMDRQSVAMTADRQWVALEDMADVVLIR